MQEKKGVLLVNLGSPDSPSVKDVRKYLKEFLMDAKVIDVSYLVRYFLVNGIIAPFRAKKSAAAYNKIWWDEGSPLKVISERLKNEVQAEVEIPVELGMRYASPSIKSAMQKLYEQGVRDLLVIPLYPQYAMSTTETVIDKCEEAQSDFKDLKLSFLPPFYHEKEYIQCLINSIEKNITEDVDAILFSYHGIPERHIFKTDKTDTCKIGSCCFMEDNPSHPKCYRHQCYQTTALVREGMNLPKSKVYQSFQSRLGRDPWLKPYTDETLENFPKNGKKRIAVIAPAFVADCLETLEELAIEGKEEFMENGGESMIYIPCLNAGKDFAKFLANQIGSYAKK